MDTAWKTASKILPEVNTLWKEGDALWNAYEAKRAETADRLNALLDIMMTAARETYTDPSTEINLEPMVLNGEMKGVKVWVNGKCAIFQSD